MFETPALQSSESTTKDEKIRKSGIKTSKDIFETYLKKDEKLNMEEFGDVYSAEEIKKDKERVEYIKASKDFAAPTPEGIVLENIFCDLVEKHKWFTEETRVVQLSEFDDKIASGAHCDVVIEIPTEGGSVVRFGIDLTTAINYDTLSKKRSKCIDAIQHGRFFSVKYFNSKVDDTKGKIDDLPVFFAGVDKETLNSLCEIMAKQENTQTNLLDKHEAQFIFLEELLAQADSYYGLALENHGEDAYISQSMDYYQRLFDWFCDNKKSLRPNNFGQKAGQDEVYKYITKFV
jgi:hypothetical protein